jgi:hypothetical protein
MRRVVAIALRVGAVGMVLHCVLVAGGDAALAAPGQIALGVGGSLGGARALPPDSPWNTPIDHLPADPASAKYIAAIGLDAPLHPDFGTRWKGAPWGIPYVVVSGDTPRFPVKFEYASESDDALYPIPPNPPIEGTIEGKGDGKDGGKGGSSDGDRHLIVIDRDHQKIYEILALRWADGGWRGACGAVWSLFGETRRPGGWTSADAAGLPIFPGLVRYDEVVELGKVEHALRFTARKTARAYLAPANHFASRDASDALPPMGLRLRLKASVDVSAFPQRVRPILIALKRYGMFLADNGGPLFLSGAPDPRWNDGELEALKKLRARDFEVVRMGNLVGP